MTNTKKQIIALGLAVSFGLLPFVAVAQAPGADTRQNIKTAREAMAKDKIKLFGEKAVTRLTAALNRADGLRQRVSLRASQFQNPKFDKVVVDQKLTEAATAITKGRTAVSVIQTAVESALSEGGTTKNGSFTEVRATIKEAMIEIRAAHQKIIEAITLIKAGYPAAPAVPVLPATTTTP